MKIVARLVAVAMVAAVLLVGSPAEAATRPTAPRAATATALNHAVKVAWLRPSRTGGASIDRYVVQRWNPNTQKWGTVRTLGARTLAWTNTGLLNGTTYYYRVLAHNRVGWSPASRQVAATPRATPGGVPGLEADTWDSELRARWGNAAANGAAIDHYAAQISTDGATWSATRKVTTLSAAFAGLTPGSRYWLRVRAHNAAGYGPYGGAGPYRAYTVPNAVQALTVTSGNGEAVLDWDAPIADAAVGRPAATTYLVERSDDDRATWSEVTTTTAPTTALTVPGLVNGESYDFRVSARPGIANIGYGPATAITTSPPVGTPAAPAGAALAWDEGDGQYVLTWSAPTITGGAPLDHYEVTTDPLAPGNELPAGQTSLAAVDGLTDQFVRACNTLGQCSSWASAAALPGQPSAPTVTPTMVGLQWQVALTWSAPTNGAAVASYRIERRSDDGPFSQVAVVTDLSYVDTTVAPETDYHYRVVAVGTGGSGRPSGAPLASTGAAQDLTADPVLLSVSEGGETTFDLVLAVASTTAVEVALSSSDPTAAVTTLGTVTIPAGQTTASVTVQGLTDDNVDDDIAIVTATVGGLSVDVAVTVTEVVAP
ncbi:fibronectin type III domain-containing protein [Nocardioides caeni]|nr:fibronectin type III domain-containing protein [Nocardioides caeni]